MGEPSIGARPTAALGDDREPLPHIPAVGICDIYHPPNDIKPIADIVFVHGLMGHPFNTWLYGKVPKPKPAQSGKQNLQETQSAQSREERAPKKQLLRGLFRRDRSSSSKSEKTDNECDSTSTPRYCYWPFDLLPRAFPDMRVLIYGYDSHPSHFYKAATNRMTITQHAEDLMHKVASERSSCRGRPLIFVAHSLGGIIVKGALNESRQMTYQPAYTDLSQSCYAIVFMGTPHLGANIADWGDILANVVGALPGGFSTYSGVLRGLTPDSETLYSIARRFNGWLDEHIQPRDKVHICSVQEGRAMSSVKGLGNKVVSDTSSKLNRPSIERSFFAQTANHMDMCKFRSERDPAWNDVSKVLQDYVLDIKSRATATSRDEDATYAIIAAELLDKLDFGTRVLRECYISRLPTTKQSFEWVWSSSFSTWMQSQSKLFWIAGHPASGKSTLVNWIAKDERLRTALRRRYGEDVIVIKFFFDYNARSGIANNFTGLRRSLLHQIIARLPKLANKVAEEFFTETRQSHDWVENDGSLMNILDYTLRSVSKPLFLFLDGLDEYQGEKPDLLRLIEDLTTSNVKICLSSRNEKPFSMSFRDLQFQFRMDKLNAPGIEAYAWTTLESSLHPNTAEEIQVLQSTAKTISKISTRVFLWARFAVLEVVEATNFGRVINEQLLHSTLQEIPPELEDIYARIFTTKKVKDKRACDILFRLVTAAKRPLHLSEVFEAAQVGGLGFLPMSQTIAEEDITRFELYIGSVTNGTLETVHLSKVRDITGRVILVRLIHRTVQTYLDRRGWLDIFQDDISCRPSHKLWIQACTAFVNGSRIRWNHSSRDEIEWALWNPHGSWRGNDRVLEEIIHEASELEISTTNKDDAETESSRSRSPYIKSLQQYVHAYLLHHALDFEQDTKTSSWPIIHTALHMEFIRSHVSLYWAYDGYEDCYPNMFRTTPFILFSDIHLAVAHRLIYYVESAMAQQTAAKLRRSTKGSLMDSEFTTGKFMEEGMHVSERCPTFLETAVLCSGESGSPLYARLVCSLVPHSARLNDEDMLYAIGHLSRVELEMLLTKFSPGPLNLLSRYIAHEHGFLKERHKLSSKQIFGPLWEIGRLSDGHGVLDLFLSRGEQINAQCGPLGTLLHANVREQLDRHSELSANYRAMFNSFLERGADINISGPEGNVLEYTWKRANTSGHKKWKYIRTYSNVIKLLIDHGATNTKPDPNGLVPSKERMLDFGHSRNEYENSQYFYIHGKDKSDLTLDRGKDPATGTVKRLLSN